MSATPAAAAFQPVRRTFGELTLPRVRAGVLHVKAGQASGRVRVIVALRLPPLAAAFRRLEGRSSATRLDMRSSSSRAYLRRIDAAQAAAIAQLRRTIPAARVQHRYRVVLDGLALSLPARRLPALMHLSFTRHVYPSVRFTLALNRSPSVIGADVLRATTGASGAGVKIGVVDDGVDPTNPFFDPTGYSYPAGFPKGGTKWTTPKVIVARVFPGPNAGAAGRLAVDRKSSFHATHVAGIAAGDAGTTATPGRDHPLVTGLSGVAPRAWIGNYRVFTVPTPIGHVANTPEIVQAFESAVEDGMNVINFSGGGPQTDPVNDAMIETVRNVAAAGVVPVISAGNDRDDFGLGTVGSPGSAPDAISVAAVSNSQVFAPALSVVSSSAPALLRQVPFALGAGGPPPPAWGQADQTLVDVGSLVDPGTGAPADRFACGPDNDPNSPAKGVFAPGSLSGAIALVRRGNCTFFSKSERVRAAGAIGIVLVDNRPGEANGIPITLSVPAGTISDLDGARLTAYLGTTGGRTAVRIGRDYQDILTNRGGVMTSFSSAGPTSFGHDLKPDVSAPGGAILSSTLPEAGGPFAVFDGTSMAAPHVSGSAALLVQRHPSWSPLQIKSALMSTAGAAWGDTARTHEASVLLEGAGLVSLPRADAPLVFTNPASLSFHDVNANRGAQSEGKLVRVTDAGGGAGTWTVELAPQSATGGARIVLPGQLELAPGGEAELPVVINTSASATAGIDTGFIVLRRGEDTRRIPYFFDVQRPQLPQYRPDQLKAVQLGTTATGQSKVGSYVWPNEPFGAPKDYFGPPQHEDGAEHVYSVNLNDAVANVGVSVILATGVIDPFFLGSLNENDVQGYAGLPTDVNGLTFDFGLDIGAAGAEFPRQGRYFVSVDSPRDPFTGQLLAGRYLLNAWVNDVTPPFVQLVTKRVAAGRPTLVARVFDDKSGVDPLSLVIAYRRILLGAAAYDPISGFALFTIPATAPKLVSKKTPGVLLASDFQETKNVNTSGPDPMPNTSIVSAPMTVTKGPALTWLLPDRNECVAKTARLVVAASATAPISSVRFYDGTKRIATVKNGPGGLYAADWKTGAKKAGKHLLRAVVTAEARSAAAERVVRVCR
ncbi:MAG: minor extracellular serine protease Vpr [Gaiellaceae bacterium]|nr:minor extracellular serine protease Vpr [Gaiellaceae bacterium]